MLVVADDEAMAVAMALDDALDFSEELVAACCSGLGCCCF